MFTVIKVIICLITFFVFSRITLWLQKRLKKSMVILVDVNALFDIMPIYQRGLVYVENKPNSSLIEYMQEHFKEIGVCPNGLNKAIMLQQKGYTLKFVIGLMTEELRPIMAHLLNLWRLRGELYMANDIDEHLKYNNPNIIGLVGRNLDSKKYARWGLKVF
jgi:hypothetical protein